MTDNERFRCPAIFTGFARSSKEGNLDGTQIVLVGSSFEMTSDRRKVALVTGITGQDGSYLAELLLEKGYEVG